MSSRFKFQCATTRAPRQKTIRWTNPGPQNLAEMLTMIRKMGYRPEDISVYDIGFEHQYGEVTL